MKAREPASVLIVLAMILIPSAAAQFPFRRAVYKPYYFAVDGPWNFTVLAELGLDGFYSPGDWTWETAVPGWSEGRYGLESVPAAANNVSYIAGQYYQQPSWEYIDFNYFHAVDERGNVETWTPAPVSEEWWQHMMMEPAVFIANLSLHYPITAIVWDMELYYSTGYHPRSYSYDGGTLRAFSEARNVSIPSLPPERRYDWLSANSLLQDYQGFQDERAYQLARELRDAVHAINPKLDLGILGFFDCWFHWDILRGFNSSTAYVSAWYEGTYRQYITEGPEGVDHYLSIWNDMNLNGQFLPGIWLLGPWGMVTEIEAAIRHNGAVWVYQRDGVPTSEYEEDLAKAYGLIQNFIFFNGTEANPLPTVELPGILAKPYGNVDGTVSVLLSEYEYGLDPPSELVIFAQDGHLTYAGENLSVRDFSVVNLTLKASDLPCLLTGLTEGDLLKINAFAFLAELQELLTYSRTLGLGEMPELQTGIEAATVEYQEGKFDEAIARLSWARVRAYEQLLEASWPIIEEAMANPRESKIPVTLLNRFTNARRALEEGRSAIGRMYLFSGIKHWSLSVGENGTFLALVTLVVLAFVLADVPLKHDPPLGRHHRYRIPPSRNQRARRCSQDGPCFLPSSVDRRSTRFSSHRIRWPLHRRGLG